MAISVNGDGCRYCQPQEYIDKLSEWLEESRAEVMSYEEKIDAQSAEPVQGEAVEVVGFVTLGGVFHGGSGPELGEIDIEPDMGVLERLQYKIVTGSDDVYLDLMTVAQHNRIMAAAKPDAELVELLRRAKQKLWTSRGDTLPSEIDAKLAEVNKE
jgi:hypothetical protein